MVFVDDPDCYTSICDELDIFAYSDALRLRVRIVRGASFLGL
jgi:hypothetical protein